MTADSQIDTMKCYSKAGNIDNELPELAAWVVCL